MAVQLVVTSPFAANSEGIARDYAVGDRITRTADVERLADSPHVVRVDPDLSDPAAPEAAPRKQQEA